MGRLREFFHSDAWHTFVKGVKTTSVVVEAVLNITLTVDNSVRDVVVVQEGGTPPKRARVGDVAANAASALYSRPAATNPGKTHVDPRRQEVTFLKPIDG